jgi:hypothetical protein
MRFLLSFILLFAFNVHAEDHNKEIVSEWNKLKTVRNLERYLDIHGGSFARSFKEHLKTNPVAKLPVVKYENGEILVTHEEEKMKFSMRGPDITVEAKGKTIKLNTIMSFNKIQSELSGMANAMTVLFTSLYFGRNTYLKQKDFQDPGVLVMTIWAACDFNKGVKGIKKTSALKKTLSQLSSHEASFCENETWDEDFCEKRLAQAMTCVEMAVSRAEKKQTRSIASEPENNSKTKVE